MIIIIGIAKNVLLFLPENNPHGRHPNIILILLNALMRTL